MIVLSTKIKAVNDMLFNSGTQTRIHRELDKLTGKDIRSLIYTGIEPEDNLTYIGVLSIINVSHKLNYSEKVIPFVINSIKKIMIENVEMIRDVEMIEKNNKEIEKMDEKEKIKFLSNHFMDPANILYKELNWNDFKKEIIKICYDEISDRPLMMQSMFPFIFLESNRDKEDKFVSLLTAITKDNITMNNFFDGLFFDSLSANYLGTSRLYVDEIYHIINKDWRYIENYNDISSKMCNVFNPYKKKTLTKGKIYKMIVYDNRDISTVLNNLKEQVSNKFFNSDTFITFNLDAIIATISEAFENCKKLSSNNETDKFLNLFSKFEDEVLYQFFNVQGMNLVLVTNGIKWVDKHIRVRTKNDNSNNSLEFEKSKLAQDNNNVIFDKEEKRNSWRSVKYISKYRENEDCYLIFNTIFNNLKNTDADNQPKTYKRFISSSHNSTPQVTAIYMSLYNSINVIPKKYKNYEALESFIKNLINILAKNNNVFICYKDEYNYNNNSLSEYILEEGNEMIPLNKSDIFGSKTSFSKFLEAVLYKHESENIYFENTNEFITKHKTINTIKSFVKIFNTMIWNLINTNYKKDKTSLSIYSSIPFVSLIIKELYECYKNGILKDPKIDKNNKSYIDLCNIFLQGYLLKYDKDLFDNIDQSRIIDSFKLNKNNFNDSVSDKIIPSSYSEYKRNYEDNQYHSENNNINSLIGLQKVKQKLKDYIVMIKTNQYRVSKGMKPVTSSKHMCFFGNPGTCKTTVANMLAKELFEAGVIKSDKCKVVGRNNLVEKYVGWTAKRIADMIYKIIDTNEAGILFVDEAYSLIDGNNKSFGQEAINTFVQLMDEPKVRENLIIIFAGYPKEMKLLLEQNPGMSSRIPNIIEFPDYNEDELIEIAKLISSNKGFKLTDAWIEKCRETIKINKSKKDFGNGRFIRNLIEKSIIKQSNRLYEESDQFKIKPDEEELVTLEKEDFDDNSNPLQKIHKKIIGFGR